MRSKKITRFRESLDKRIRNGVTNCRKLFTEITKQGYAGSYISVYRYLKSYQREQEASFRVSLRFETQPGEQAQVDWGSFGKIEVNGKKERLYAFVYVLGWSRMMHVEFTIKQTLPVLQQCHIYVFEKLGIPRTIVYDNMKTVVLRREKLFNRNEKLHYNPAFLDFAQYYGFKIYLCPPYWPRAKGKVESGVKYLRNNFMQGMRFGKDFLSLVELNQKVSIWLENVANKRLHKTTNEVPHERWNIEKNYLRFSHEFPPYQTSRFISLNSMQNGMLQYKYNFYSVPLEFARRKLLVEEIYENGIGYIKLYHEDKLITTHKLSSARGEWITKDEHLKLHQGKSKERRKEKTPVAFSRDLSYYNQLLLRSKNE